MQFQSTVHAAYRKNVVHNNKNKIITPASPTISLLIYDLRLI